MLPKPPPEFKTTYDRACALFHEGKDDEGNREMAKACRLSPEAWIGIGCALMKKGDSELAIRRFEEAAHMAKGRPQTRAIALNNLGMMLANTGERGRSAPMFDEAVKLYPQYADGWSNKSLVHKWHGELAAALDCIHKSLKFNPWHGQAEFTRALILLMGGNFKEGWPAYESRWRIQEGTLRKLEVPYPEWDGTNHQPGQRLLIYAEQGMGDTIQMLRYVPQLKALGLKLSFTVQLPLMSLLATTGWFTELFAIGEPVRCFDLQVPIFSLPRILQQFSEDDLPCTPYLTAPKPMNWGPGFHVGIVWRGNKAHKNNPWRTSKLTDWRPLLETPGATFHQLQVGEGLEELDEFPQVVRHSLPRDFLETANRMAGMDLIITIDTSIVHLAGAMGLPVWMLTPVGPDFRWQLDRPDSPWYPTLKLFRQAKEFDWSDVMKLMTKTLNETIHSPNAQPLGMVLRP